MTPCPAGVGHLGACGSCGAWLPAGAPACASCVAWIDDDLDSAWHAALVEYGVGPDDELAFAETIAGDPRGVPWRVVDAALVRLRCAACEGRLGSGPAGCAACDQAHGLRWLAAEPDRPDVPPGNEHAVRVATAVARVPQRFPPHVVPMYASGLALLIAGELPTIAQATAIKRYLERGGDVVRLHGCRSFAEAYALASGRER